MEDGQRLVGLLCGDGQHHADAHVEGVEHIVLRDAAHLLHQVEERRGADVRLADAGAAALLQAAGDILIEAAAGDVGDALDIHLFQHLEHRLDIDLGGGQQGLAQRLAAQLSGSRLQDIGVVVDIKNFAYQ